MTAAGPDPHDLAAIAAELAVSADRLSRLQHIGSRLATALTTDQVVAAVIEELQAPEGASARVIWLADDEGRTLHLAGSAGMRPEAASMFESIALGSSLPGAVACRERRTVISPSRHDTVERFPELHDAPRSSDGFVAVPLLVDQGSLGVLAFGYTGALNESDVVFLEAAAGHVAQTLSRVRLSEALARRADEADAAARRERRRSEQFEFVAAVTQAAAAATHHRQLMLGVAAAALPMLGEWCSVHFVPEPGATLETVVAHVDPIRQPWADELAHNFPLDPLRRRGVAGVVASIATTESASFAGSEIVDATVRFEIAPHEAQAFFDASGHGSVLTVPIATKRRVIGALRAARTGPGRAHDQDDIVSAEMVALRIADALENMWLTDQYRHISVTLQHALLPPSLPAVANLDVAAVYLPAGTASDVGGDFYDLFALDASTSALLIGDACGTGPNAAALTSIARHTARAAARHGRGHREVLEWVNQAVRLSDRDLFCTACYATIEQSDRPEGPMTVRFTSGGHPLPIHRNDDGAASVGAPGTLLGVFERISGSVHELHLGRGEALVFYTDGITDVPGPNGRTEHELADLIAALPRDLTAQQIADAIRADLAERVPDTDRHDDVAMIVVRRT